MKKNTLEQARQVLGLPNLNDKVICFISSWERTKTIDYAPAEEDEKEYAFQELRLFLQSKNFLYEGCFSFVVFREFEHDDIDFEEIEKAKKDFRKLYGDKSEDFWEGASWEARLSDFLGKQTIEYLKYQGKINDLVGHNIRVMPVNPTTLKYLDMLKESKKLVELHRLNILCIDYTYFPYFVISHFLKFMEALGNRKKLDIEEKFKPLYDLFQKSSPEVKMWTNYELERLINSAYKNNLKISDWDKIEFLSINHLQNTRIFWFWDDIKRNGYLCKGNEDNLKINKEKKNSDIRVFYSLESLLFYELKNCLKRIKRCCNCGAILPNNKNLYKGKYCPPDSESYRQCFTERNRKRQKKYYNLTKI